MVPWEVVPLWCQVRLAMVSTSVTGKVGLSMVVTIPIVSMIQMFAVKDSQQQYGWKGVKPQQMDTWWVMVRIIIPLKVNYGPQLIIKMSSFPYWKSHCGDKTIARSSYLHNGISYTGKMSSLYLIRAMVTTECKTVCIFSRPVRLQLILLLLQTMIIFCVY